MTHGVDAARCREAFQRILAEEIELLGQLEPLLREEHGHLSANDIEALERAGDRRQACVARLMKLGEERRDLCRLLGHGADAAGVAALLAACDPERSLAPLLARHAEQSASCRAQNELNGALVSARMARVGNMLGLLGGGPSAAPVYAASGTRGPAAPAAGRLLAVRA